MSEVLYRKYRPGKWAEVRGQDHVVSVLSSALKEGNIAHAYLFHGSRGTGKTSVARIVAQVIGTSEKDVYEIDAASNRRIEDIRELRDAVHVLPFESTYKVYIIDEVHMLTKESFNALLKTLEEPPKHVIFILATTELHKLPDTIVSRCQAFTFKKPSHTILKKLVQDIAKKEGYSIDAASADLIALLGDGSFRDTEGILQKVMSASSDKKITHEEIEKIVGAPGPKLVNDYIEALAYGKTEEGMKAIARAAEENIDMQVYVKLILHKLRAVLLFRFAPEVGKTMAEDFSEEDAQFLRALAEDKGAQISSKTLVSVIDAAGLIGKAYIPHLPLELVLVEGSSKISDHE